MAVVLEVVSSEGVVTKEGLVGGGDMLIVPITPRALHLSHTDRQRDLALSFFITPTLPNTSFSL